MLHFEPGAALAQIEQERATWLYSVFPPIVMALIRHPEFSSRDSVVGPRLLNVAPPDTLPVDAGRLPAGGAGRRALRDDRVRGRDHCNEWEASEEHRAGPAAPAAGVEVRVVDPETGAPLGRAPASSRSAAAGCSRATTGTRSRPRRCSTAEGWLRSGDQGRIDEDGRMHYLGRLKDMLKVGGENVAPIEIESHLSTHPAVKLVQVVGGARRAPRRGARRVHRAGSRARSSSADEAVEYCKGQIASFKVPRHVRFVSAEEWPMSATKIQKFRLQERIAKELKEEEATVR